MSDNRTELIVVTDVMKFHHLGQLLLDSNCLLLILKMFGLQEVSVTVASKHDSPENKWVACFHHSVPVKRNPFIGSFFRYCQSRASMHQNFRENVAPPTKPMDRGNTRNNSDEEVECLTDFSWRNFFSSINYVKIMQKLSKHRSHRIWLLVQYKSSVGTAPFSYYRLKLD